ncbi:CAP-Gly domain-containing linker protein 1-like [Saccostrea echinata]|uniref:CAP-Gly domain-containing linker protein 1-like n=1 Tax=Saccostrea echinata TaxID=191078 RepID=UPI002A7F38A4|nr:CAP-Gly domain-containing linker protein 1-like [Saccostrea echinata]
MVEGFSNFETEINKRIDDIRIDMQHQDLELYEEIKKLKQMLTQQGFAQDAQSQNGDILFPESGELSSRLKSLEAGMKRDSKDSKSQVRALRQKIKILENENKILSSRVDATQVTLMLMSERTSLKMNESNGLNNLNLVQKISNMEERLSYLNDSIQEKRNSSVEADEFTTLKNELQTVRLNLSEVKNDLNQSKTFSELQGRQILEARESQTLFYDTLNILENNISTIWMYTSNLRRDFQELGDLKDIKGNLSIIEGTTSVIEAKIQMLQDNLSTLTVVSNNLSFELNSTEEKIEDVLKLSETNNNSQLILERILKEEIDTIQKNVSSIAISVQLESNERKNLLNVNEQRYLNITSDMESIQTKMNSTVQQLMILGAEKERVSILIKNVTDHKNRLQDVVAVVQSNSRTISDIQSNITALLEIDGALNKSFSQQISDGAQQKRNTLILGVKLQKLQDDLSALTVVSNNLLSQFNSTGERIEDLLRISEDKNNSDIILKRNLTEKIEAIQQNVSSLAISVQLESNQRRDLLNIQEQRYFNITNVIESIQYQMNSTVQQQMALEEEKEHVSLFIKNITDHEKRIKDIVTVVQSNGNTISYIRSNITALMEITGALNRSLSQQISERNQQQLLVRLVGGSTISEGRVEVYHSNVWGTICDDNWGSSDARVVCRMLGYSGSYTAYSNARYGQGVGQIWMDEVGCSGSESSIFSCRNNGWGVHDCSHGEDASVKCT